MGSGPFIKNPDEVLLVGRIISSANLVLPPALSHVPGITGKRRAASPRLNKRVAADLQALRNWFHLDPTGLDLLQCREHDFDRLCSSR